MVWLRNLTNCARLIHSVIALFHCLRLHCFCRTRSSGHLWREDRLFPWESLRQYSGYIVRVAVRTALFGFAGRTNVLVWHWRIAFSLCLKKEGRLIHLSCWSEGRGELQPPPTPIFSSFSAPPPSLISPLDWQTVFTISAVVGCSVCVCNYRCCSREPTQTPSRTDG